MTLRAELWSRPEGRWHPLCWGSRRPPHLSEGQTSLQRQEELEMMCMQLQQQVGEMEVREVVARAVRNQVRAHLTGPPSPRIPHRGSALSPYGG